MMRQKAQALVVVVTFLAMFSLMGVAFFVLAQTERRAAIRQLYNVRARYIAEAGIAYARKVLSLDRENNLIDSLDDISFQHFQGQDVDLNGDGKAESKWFNILDSQGALFGQFAVKVSDEASKININVCKEGILEKLFSQLGIDTAKAGSLLAQRPLNAIEQIGSILEKEDFNLAKDFITIYSLDREIDLKRKRRLYLNSPNPQAILEMFLVRGIKDAYQKAAILKDAQDTDLSQTMLDKFYLTNLSPSSLLEPGDWRKVGSFYEAPAAGDSGKFAWSNLAVEDGDYFCFIYGKDPQDVVGKVESQYVLSGEGLINPVTVSGGALTLNITPAPDTTSRLSHIELVSMYPKRGLNKKIVTGTEGLVINELMVKPTQEIIVGLPDIPPGQSLQHTFTDIRPGNYYLVVFSKNKGGLVGDVSIGGKTATDLHDRDYFPYTIEVKGDGLIRLDIKNNSFETSSLKGIKISQQPDGEFIELLNLSSQEIDISNFSLEAYSSTGELIPAWPAHIPKNTHIQPLQHLTFNIDDNDASPSPAKLRNNKISFKEIWKFKGVGLIFEDYFNTIDKTFDLIPDNGGWVILKDAEGKRIDAVEYKNFQVMDFRSLERPDPTAKIDSDGDGLFDGWYLSEDYNKATPNLTNENIGMYTTEGPNLIKHSPNEIKFLNRAIVDSTEIIQLSSGENWGKFSLLDLARIHDSFAYTAKDLDLIGHYLGGEFEEKDSLFESSQRADSGIWQFTNIPVGTYGLSLEGTDSEGLRLLVAYRQDSEEEFSDFSSLVVYDGIANYGQVQLLGERECNFELKIINDSDKKLILKRVILAPITYKQGRINVNTAEERILGSLLESEDLVQKILQNRPIGNKDERKLGIGELLILDSNFLSLCDQLTVKSDVFELNCRGQYLPSGNILASQTIRTIIERGE